jgi:Zn finger protein HypA/HybF involved in hydrogenase expression
MNDCSVQDCVGLSSDADDGNGVFLCPEHRATLELVSQKGQCPHCQSERFGDEDLTGTILIDTEFEGIQVFVECPQCGTQWTLTARLLIVDQGHNPWDYGS